MDLSIQVEDYLLNIRASAIIRNGDKILFHHNTKKDHYALPGGRVMAGEDSEKTVIREIKEEIGQEIEITGYIGTIENFFEMESKPYQEILFVQEAKMKQEKDIQNVYQNLEGKKHLQYEWVDIKQLDQINLKPKVIKDILKKGQFPIHYIQNELQDKEG